MIPVNESKKKRHPATRAAVSIALGVALAFVCHALPMPYQVACLEVSKVVQAFVGGVL